ncbi:sensor histidine kinase [Psychroflexus sp. MES1-P1E]|uniref:sensor histidine kinase n=1 Tax=Psychroflexus sp. MES1-P1E TaxID=2058320 RepID=UPI000C7A0B4D|nr:PAS domain-containing sensor histidine kinase [Psychroflexus sp. MES1-P1E]PKG41672.1 PAS domain-containing sensor histidine kinase [Psychroflexus sp. MES1-P1E]
MDAFKKGSNIFKILSEAVSEGIIIVNSSHIIVETNDSANQIFGYEKEELIGQHLDILIPNQYRHGHDKHVAGFMKKGQKRQMGRGRDLYGCRKDGSEFPVEAGLNPFSVYDSNYVMALVIDISVRKKAEQELQHWANIFNESLNEIFIFDSKSLQFLNVNKGALKNIGYSLEELKTMTPLNIKPDFDRIQFIEKIKPLLNDSLDKLKFNTIHKRKDGTIYPVEVHLQKSSLRENDMLVAIILDITEQEKYTQKLEETVDQRTHQLQKALTKEKELGELKTKFLSLVAHEFKTPLSGIMTSATLAGKYPKEEQQVKREKHLKTIRGKVKYLNNIINDFLSIERLESGKFNYSFTNFPISKVVNEVIYDANMLLKENQHIEYPDHIDSIYLNFDEKILELILTNLINNAIKYSSEDSTVYIVAEEIDDTLAFSIRDEGIGIPETEQKHIFNRYFRAENALLNQGTGIGLNIVKTHLENLGGTITFTSTEGEGSVFKVKIPSKTS